VSLSVVFTPEAEGQLLELDSYIAAAGSTEVAALHGTDRGVLRGSGCIPASWQGA
jgi:hypothetical protein